MTEQGYYDQSIPPALLVGGGRRVAGSAPAGGGRSALPAGAGAQNGAGAVSPAAPAPAPAEAAQPSSPRLGATAGAPGQYAPAVKATQRPHNVTQLNTDQVTADPIDPWPAGDYVPVGGSGRRAHWTGTEWRGGESPGYPVAPAETAGTAPVPLPPAPYQRPQFPGDEQDGDLTR